MSPVFTLPVLVPCKNTTVLFCKSFLPTSAAAASWRQEVIIMVIGAFSGSFTPKLHIPGFWLATSQKISDCTTEEAAFAHVHTHRPVRSRTLNKRRLLPHFSPSQQLSCTYMSVTAFFALLGPTCYNGWPAEQRSDNLWWLRAEERPPLGMYSSTGWEGTGSIFPLLHE